MGSPRQHNQQVQPASSRQSSRSSIGKWLKDKAEISLGNSTLGFLFKTTVPRWQGLLVGLLFLLALGAIGGVIFLRPPDCVYANEAKSDHESMVWLIQAEGGAIIKEDLNLIKKIFAPDAVVIDQLSGERWLNPVERYERLFADADYINAAHATIKSAAPLQPLTAYYTSGSFGSYKKAGQNTAVSYQNPADADHWTFVKSSGCWVIKKLHFNASGVPFPP